MTEGEVDEVKSYHKGEPDKHVERPSGECQTDKLKVS
jgi:hypothetical protein